MTAETAFAFYRSLPTAPISATSTKFSSKFTEEQRQLIINVLWWFLTAEKTPEWMRKSTSGDVYSKDIARRFKMVEVKVDHDRAKTVVEIGVEPDMCNIYGTLHGGCAAFLIDSVVGAPLVSLGIASGQDLTGPTISMDLKWFRPATIGMTIQLIATVELKPSSKKQKVFVQIVDKETQKKLVQGVQLRQTSGLIAPPIKASL